MGDREGKPGPERTAQLVNMAVDPNTRRAGIARLLLACAEQHALDQGAAVLRLAVHVDNAPARHLYTIAGFTEVPASSPFESVLRLGRRAGLMHLSKPLTG